MASISLYQVLLFQAAEFGFDGTDSRSAQPPLKRPIDIRRSIWLTVGEILLSREI
ncbi:hypothetical protein M413DRAFT_448406 [Hebeloma cylindrosporum]|uniref:Uncharacterized protein n=1 Tax=Hebeloma cylindrosporum TaxID=76867 RepID=A0A0C2Y9C1_HEBCY|nr:hypothetical protein M413DRAFT_448406 [Hebeloma cylindrosporum h7]